MAESLQPAAGGWATRPIFISSTFADMHAERDHLRKVVFPRLEEMLRQRRHEFQPIDLRLGVLTADLPDEAARESHVLKVCLDEIERSRPFLIILLGDRYGWVPAPERLQAAAREKGYTKPLAGKSVTALEIEFGLMKTDAEQRRRSFIYLREPLPYDAMEPNVAAQFSEAHAADPEAPDRKNALRALKADLQADPELSARVHPYQARWDNAPPRPHVAGLEAWGEMVFQHLWADLDAETAAHANAPPQTWQEQERSELREFIGERRRDYIGREELLAKLVTVTPGGTAPAAAATAATGLIGACVVGAPGSGKSALWAELHHRLGADASLVILANAAGATQHGAQVDSMLRRFVGELADALQITNPLADDAGPEEIENSFFALLNLTAQHRRVVVLLDALDQFEPGARAQQLAWLQPARWPANARLLATAQPTAPGAQALAAHAGMMPLTLPALAQPDIQGIATRVYKRYGRELDPQVLMALAAKRLQDNSPAAGNPLWLTLALEQLNLLDSDDFARAERDHADITDPAARLRALMLDTVAQMLPDVPGLYRWLLDYTERSYGTVQARGFAAAIALSRYGWREQDLVGIVPRVGKKLFPDQPEVVMDDLSVATLRRGFRAHLIRRGAAGQLDFLHAQMRQAVLQRSAPEEEKRKPLHGAISDHLQTLPAADPIIALERMAHLIGERDALRAARYYATVDATGASAAVHQGSTWTLVEWLTTASSDVNRDLRLAWLGGWLGLSDLETPELEQVAKNVVYGLAGSMKALLPTGVLSALLRSAQAAWQRQASLDPSNDALQRELSVSHERIGDILQAQGDSAGALGAFRAGMEIAERLARAVPGNAGWQHDLSVSHDRIGGILQAQGDSAGALGAFRASMNIRERLARADPGNAGWQRDLSVSHIKMGEILQAQGDLAGALGAFRAGMDIAERLASADPGNAGWQSDLSVSHNRVGEILQAQGDSAGALGAFRAGMDIAERLARADPANADWQRGLAVSHIKIGDILRAQGDLAGALRVFRASMDILERLARADPGNVGWQRDLSVSRGRIGAILQAQGDLAGALGAFRADMEIAERLARADRGNAGWQNDLSVSHDRIGRILQAQGDLAGALKAFRAGMEIAERLARADPGNAGWQRDLSVSHIKMGEILQAQGDLAGALGAFRAGMDIAERLASADPGNAGWQSDLSASHERIGNILQAQGDVAGALGAFSARISISELLARTDPANARWQSDLAASHDSIGEILLQALGDLDRALAGFRASKDIRERLAGADPTNGDWQRDLSASHYKIGVILQAQGDLAGALGAFRAGMEIAERLARAYPANADWQHDLCVSHGKVGEILQAQGDLAGALKAFRASMDIAERLARADPANAGWQSDLSASHVKIGEILQAQADLAGAVKAYSAGMEIRERLARAYPANADWQRAVIVSHTRLSSAAAACFDVAAARWHMAKCLRVMQTMQRVGTQLDAWSSQLKDQIEAAGISEDEADREEPPLRLDAWSSLMTPVLAAAGISEDKASHDEPPPSALTPSSRLPTPLPDTDTPAARAARLNIGYQQALAQWNRLSWWQRLRTKKPEPPSGI